MAKTKKSLSVLKYLLGLIPGDITFFFRKVTRGAKTCPVLCYFKNTKILNSQMPLEAYPDVDCKKIPFNSSSWL
jgi:hypothetical protein